jgi:RimJ/RimL family protein N-acetyltransferase
MDPQNYTASETLKDGTPVTIRAIRHDDGNTILEAFKNPDRDSVCRRFFSPKKDLMEADLEQLTDVDFSQVVALVVTTQGEDGETLIGGGRYARDGIGSVEAELAFTTDGNYRGVGIATLILRHLVRVAREAGVSRFEADVLADNEPMLAIFRHSGLSMQLRRDGGVLHVTLSLQQDSRQQT